MKKSKNVDKEVSGIWNSKKQKKNAGSDGVNTPFPRPHKCILKAPDLLQWPFSSLHSFWVNIPSFLLLGCWQIQCLVVVASISLIYISPCITLGGSYITLLHYTTSVFSYLHIANAMWRGWQSGIPMIRDIGAVQLESRAR